LSGIFYEQLHSDLGRQIKCLSFIELTSFKSLFLVQLQACTLEQNDHLLVICPEKVLMKGSML